MSNMDVEQFWGWVTNDKLYLLDTLIEVNFL